MWSKSLSIIAIVLAGLAFSGCASPWTADKPPSTGLTPTTNQTAIGPRRPCDLRQLEDLTAEMHQSGTLDAAAEEQLAADLRRAIRRSGRW